MKSIEELAEVEDPAWPALSDALLDARDVATVLPIEDSPGRRCLHRLQVTARSTLGALALHTGGVVIDHGWLRLLGGGGSGLIDLATANESELAGASGEGFMLIAFDVVGGRFAINGGGLDGSPGEVNYWGPGTLDWAPLGAGHSEFVHWSLSDGVASFYAGLRWAGWEAEVEAVGLDEGLNVYPPLCTTESRPVELTSRRPVAWTELTTLLAELARLADGPVRIEVDD